MQARKICLALLLATSLIIPSAGAAYAANTTDTEFKFNLSFWGPKTAETEYRIKYNTTKVYFYVIKNDVSSPVKLYTYGAKNKNGLGVGNDTKDGVALLSAKRTGKFSISNNVREHRKSHVKIRVELDGSIGGSMVGLWSPDSTRNYTVLN